MPRSQFNDGQEIVQGDLNAGSSSRLEMELYDRLIYELMGRQQNLCFGDGFSVTYTNGTTISVKKGSGVYFDNTQVDPEPMTRLLYLPTNTAKTITTPDASQNRIDLVSIAPARAVVATASRNFKDATSGAVSTQTLNVETDWLSLVTITAGTPSGSPAVPSTPAGSIALAQMLVTAVTGLASQSAITDVRIRYRYGNAVAALQAITSNYTVDLDDDVIKVNCNGGAVTVTLPAASLTAKHRYTIIKIDSSGNALTIAGAGADTIMGSATQSVASQYTSITVYSDGSQWFII